MKLSLKYFLIVLFFQTTIKLSAQDKLPAFTLKGYIKDIESFSFGDNLDSVVTSNLIHNRINFKWDFRKHFYTRIEVRNRIYYGEQVRLIPSFSENISADNGYFDLTHVWSHEKNFAAVSTFDRFLINYSNEKTMVTVGRQRINWGINTIWNPNDLFNAYDFLDFDYEERPGVDAVRLQYFMKSMSAIEFAIKPSENKNQNVIAALYKFNRWQYDFQILSGIYYNDIVAGGGWAGNIGKTGFKGELSYFHNRVDPLGPKENFVTSITIDYSTKNSWYISGSALFNQNPTPYLYAATNLFGANLSAKSLMPYQFSYYAGLIKSFTPLLSGTFAVIYSPDHNSTIFFPSVAYNFANNFDLDLTIQSFLSDLTGTFSNTINSAYLRIRWSFAS